MALIRCPGCGENISEYERSCPFCGKLVKLDNGRKVIHNNIFFKEEYSKINIKCPNCKSKCDVQTEKVGLDENDNSVYHTIAYCNRCGEKYDLDMQELLVKSHRSILGICTAIIAVISIVFMGVPIIGWLLAFVAFVLGLIDCAISDEHHGDAIFGIIVFAAWTVIIILNFLN